MAQCGGPAAMKPGDAAPSGRPTPDVAFSGPVDAVRIVEIMREMLQRPFTPVTAVGSQLAEKVGKAALVELHRRELPGARYRLRALLEHLGKPHGLEVITVGQGNEGSHEFLARPVAWSDRAQPSFTAKVHSLLPRGVCVETGVLFTMFNLVWPDEATSLLDFAKEMDNVHGFCCSVQKNGTWKLQVKPMVAVQKIAVGSDVGAVNVDLADRVSASVKPLLPLVSPALPDNLQRLPPGKSATSASGLESNEAAVSPASHEDPGDLPAISEPSTRAQRRIKLRPSSIPELAALCPLSTLLSETTKFPFTALKAIHGVVQRHIKWTDLQLGPPSSERETWNVRFSKFMCAVIDAGLLPGLTFRAVSGGTFQRLYIAREPTQTEQNIRGFRERIHALVFPGLSAEEEVLYELYRSVWTSDVMPREQFGRLLLEVHDGCCNHVPIINAQVPQWLWIINPKARPMEAPRRSFAASDPIQCLGAPQNQELRVQAEEGVSDAGATTCKAVADVTRRARVDGAGDGNQRLRELSPPRSTLTVASLVATIRVTAGKLFTKVSPICTALFVEFGGQQVRGFFEDRYPTKRYKFTRLLVGVLADGLLPDYKLDDIHNLPEGQGPLVPYLARRPTAQEQQLDQFRDRIHVLVKSDMNVPEISLWDMYCRVWTEDQMDLERFSRLMEGHSECCQRLPGQCWNISPFLETSDAETSSSLADSIATLDPGPIHPETERATESPLGLDLTQALAIVRSLPSRLELEDFNTFFFECLDAGAMDVDG